MVFPHIDIQLFRYHLLRYYPFFINHSCPFAENHVIMYAWVYIWTLYSVSLIYMSIPTPIYIVITVTLY